MKEHIEFGHGRPCSLLAIMKPASDDGLHDEKKVPKGNGVSENRANPKETWSVLAAHKGMINKTLPTIIYVME